MNISTDKEIGIGQKKFTFSDHGSPYLSPLHGLSQPSEQFQDEQIPELEIDPSQNKSDEMEHVFSNNFQKKQIPFFSLPHDDSDLHLSNIESRVKNEEDQIKGVSGEMGEHRENVEGLDPGNTTSLINFLVEHDELSEGELKGFCEYFCGGSEQLRIIFQILADKFKKLKKTKEEMTKYCMRKAFRFISDFKLNIKKKGNVKTETELSISKISYEIPFKKNSQEKTMNSQFLKQTFSREQFVIGYQEFLKQIHQLIEQDNALKVTAFAESIEKSIQNKQFDRIRKWNRLPWTAKILERTEKLAISLLEYAKFQEKVENPRNGEESMQS